MWAAACAETHSKSVYKSSDLFTQSLINDVRWVGLSGGMEQLQIKTERGGMVIVFFFHTCIVTLMTSVKINKSHYASLLLKC